MTWKRVDGNQDRIVEKLRELGLSVQILSSLGKGCPDLLIGVANVNVLVEVKASSKATLTPDQIEFLGKWQGCYIIGWDVVQIVKHLVAFLDVFGESRHVDSIHLKDWIDSQENKGI